MKNREKYKNELIKSINEDGMICKFVKKHEVYRMSGNNSKSHCKMTCVTCGTALNLWLDEEYEEPEVDWNNVPMDTLVRVRDYESDEWILRYFNGFNSAGHPQNTNPDVTTRYYEVWALGATSVTAEGDTESWRYCELVEGKEVIK